MVPAPRIGQGDVYRNIDYIERVDESPDAVTISKIAFPHVVVLTQDCDLAQDDKFRTSAPPLPTQDKYLLSILVAPMYNIENFFSGAHLSTLELKMREFPSKAERAHKNDLKNNDMPRYHYLTFPTNVTLVPSVVDFKQYFSVPVAYLSALRPTNFVYALAALYREDLSQRFAAYLSRIGLPDDLEQYTPSDA